MEKIKNIEFLRFIFTVFICIYHYLLCGNLFHNELMNTNKYGLATASQYIFVEFFFILAGYFLYRGNKKSETSLTSFILKKLERLYPAMIVTTLCIFILSIIAQIKFSSVENLFTFLMLQCVVLPKASGNLHTLWFVCAYFWVTSLYFMLTKTITNNNARNLIIVILVIWTLSVINMLDSGHFTIQRKTFCGIGGGIIRAIPTVGIGYLMGIVLEKFNKPRIIHCLNNKLTSFVVGIIELVLIGLVIYYTTFKVEKNYGDFLCLFILIMIIFCFLLKIGFVSKFFNNNLSALLGKYSYSIYVSNIFVWEFFSKYVWQNQELIKNNYYIVLTLFIFCNIFWGIFSYYILERPIQNILNKAFQYIHKERESITPQ